MTAIQANGAGESVVANDWTLKLSPQMFYVGYAGSPVRNDLIGSGVYFDAQYLDRGSIAGGAVYTRLNLKEKYSALNQASEFLSGQLNFTPESLPGRLSLRVDGHQINNDDPYNESDDVQALASLVSFFHESKSFYVDLGYAISFYNESPLTVQQFIPPSLLKKVNKGSLTVQQWTPTLGVGFNQGQDWLQLRLYDISVSNPKRAMRPHTDAVEIGLTHYLASQSVWMPRWVMVGALVGNRMYAVDADTELVYNLSDEQKGGGFVTAQWDLSAHYKATLSGGYDVYETRNETDDRYLYSGTHVYMGMTAQW